MVQWDAWTHWTNDPAITLFGEDLASADAHWPGTQHAGSSLEPWRGAGCGSAGGGGAVWWDSCMQKGAVAQCLALTDPEAWHQGEPFITGATTDLANTDIYTGLAWCARFNSDRGCLLAGAIPCCLFMQVVYEACDTDVQSYAKKQRDQRPVCCDKGVKINRLDPRRATNCLLGCIRKSIAFGMWSQLRTPSCWPHPM